MNSVLRILLILLPHIAILPVKSGPPIQPSELGHKESWGEKPRPEGPFLHLGFNFPNGRDGSHPEPLQPFDHRIEASLSPKPGQVDYLHEIGRDHGQNQDSQGQPIFESGASPYQISPGMEIDFFKNERERLSGHLEEVEDGTVSKSRIGEKSDVTDDELQLSISLPLHTSKFNNKRKEFSGNTGGLVAEGSSMNTKNRGFETTDNLVNVFPLEDSEPQKKKEKGISTSVILGKRITEGEINHTNPGTFSNAANLESAKVADVDTNCSKRRGGQNWIPPSETKSNPATRKANIVQSRNHEQGNFIVDTSSNLKISDKTKITGEVGATKSSRNNSSIISEDDLNIEEESNDLSNLEHTQMIWGWIFGISLYRAQAIHQEMKLTYSSTISDFNTKIRNHIIRIMEQGDPAKRIDSKEIDQNVSKLSNILWFINIRFIQNLATLQSVDFDSAKECCLIYKWILDIFEDNKESPISTSSKLKRKKLLNTIDSESVVLTVTSALLSGKNDNMFYEIVKSAKRKQHESYSITSVGVISEIDLLVTKAAVIVSSFYYKDVSNRKWKTLFISDLGFLNHLERLQTHSYYCTPHLRTAIRGITSISTLPWAEDFNRTSKIEHYDPRYGKSTQVPLTRFLIDISNQNNKLYSSRISELLDQQLYSNSHSNEGIWICISFLKKIYQLKRGTLNGFNPKYLNPNLKILYSTIGKSDEKNVFHPIYPSISADLFFQNLNKFSQTLWELNSTLMEALGHQEEDDLFVYQQEQNKMQQEMFFIINLSPDDADQSLDPETKKIALKLQNLMFRALHYSSETSFDVQDQVEIKAVVILMAYVYSKSYRSKWSTIFQNEFNFIDTLLRIEARLRVKEKYIKFKNIYIPFVRPANLIPWRNPSSLSSSQKQKMSWLFQKQKHLN